MRAVVTLVSLLLLGAQAQHEWSYSGKPGGLEEDLWPQEYPACGGHRQSPIDLQQNKVRFNPALKALNLTGYQEDRGDEFTMINNGHTVQINLPPTMRMMAPDGTEYIAKQMHYHWGGGSSEVSGSEHTIDGIRHVIEIHVVHYNAKYDSYDIAKDASDGLAVLAAFVEVGRGLWKMGQRTILRGLDIQDMLPGDLHHYYTYEGSLTTPPCTENVHWFVLADSVKLSRSQVWKLENSLLNFRNETLHNDYRKTQALHRRVVEANFQYFPNQRECAPPAKKKSNKKARHWGHLEGAGLLRQCIHGQQQCQKKKQGWNGWMETPMYQSHQAHIRALQCGPEAQTRVEIAKGATYAVQGEK
uniref:Carbonic anhydrase n=1 Tax=Urocitellus parryii TaxID=9999 RepID=A0A8D2KBV0_UROPR